MTEEVHRNNQRSCDYLRGWWGRKGMKLLREEYGSSERFKRPDGTQYSISITYPDKYGSTSKPYQTQSMVIGVLPPSFEALKYD